MKASITARTASTPMTITRTCRAMILRDRQSCDFRGIYWEYLKLTRQFIFPAAMTKNDWDDVNLLARNPDTTHDTCLTDIPADYEYGARVQRSQHVQAANRGRRQMCAAW